MLAPDPFRTSNAVDAADQRPATQLSSRRRRSGGLPGDRRGALSIETILILAAIAIPILIFILKVGWPKIQKYFNESSDNLIEESYNAQEGVSR